MPREREVIAVTEGKNLSEQMRFVFTAMYFSNLPNIKTSLNGYTRD